MATITAIIQWQREGAQFLDNRYSRRHSWKFDGGTELVASSSPDVVPVPMSDESAVDPEEAFVASLSSCHMLWFLALAAKKKFVVESYRDDAIGEMQKNDKGKLVISKVILKPDIQWQGENRPTEEQVDELHHRAHEECFIANSVRTEIVIESVG